jgi:hypothetical protein
MAPATLRYTEGRVTKPEKSPPHGGKQDGTMELDINQIDLLDLPLPPHSSPGVTDAADADSPRVSKGPPPLPPSLNPPDPAEAAPPAAEAKPRVLSMPPPPEPPPGPVISARSLVDTQTAQRSPIGRFLIGMGGATVLCVIGFVVLRSYLHKAPPAAPPATSVAPAPTHTFTMAPIEFTASSGSVDSTSDPQPQSTAAPSAPLPQVSATAHGTSAPRPSAQGSAKPRNRPDDVIKVEN